MASTMALSKAEQNALCVSYDVAHAVETFFDLWGVILCVELRGVDLDGSEYPVCI